MESVKVKRLKTEEKTEHSKARKFRLYVLSPIHIGGYRQKLTKAHFLDSGEIISEEKLFRTLYGKEPELIDQYMKHVTEGGNLKFFIQEIKDKFGGKQKLMDKITAYTVNDSFLSRGTIRPFIRNGRFQPYIPGTELKGAIRTAILYEIIDNQITRPVFNNFLMSEIYKEENAARKEGRRPDRSNISDEFIIDKIDKEVAPVDEFTKFIEITDSETISKDSLNLNRVLIISQGEQTRDIHQECMEVVTRNNPNHPFILRIRNNSVGLSYLQKNDDNLSFLKNWMNLKEVLRKFADKIMDIERDHTEWLRDDASGTLYGQLNGTIEFYDHLIKLQPEERPNLRLGWGLGLNSITMRTLMKAQNIDDLRKMFDSKVSWRHFPKSRRFVECEDKLLPLGWCRLEPTPDGGE